MTKLERFWAYVLLFIMGTLIAFVGLTGLGLAFCALVALLKHARPLIPVAVLAALVVLTWMREL
jgi:hypothetical protein